MNLLSILLSLSLHPACIQEADNRMGGSEASYYRGSFAQRIWTCEQVARAAEADGLSVTTAVVLSWEESEWRASLVHPRTKVAGPLQVAARWWCPGGTLAGCDVVRAGVRAVNYYMTQHHDSRVLGLCHYNAGNVCWPRSLRRARYIDSKIRRLEQQLGYCPNHGSCVEDRRTPVRPWTSLSS